MIGKIFALILLGVGFISNLYKAGKYANGGKDVYQGKSATVASGISAIVGLAVFTLIWFDL